MIERILVPGIMEPVSHYCHVVRARPHVWVSGIVGMDGDGAVPEGVVAQFDLAIGVMDRCLKAAGAGAEHVVKVQVSLTSINDRSTYSLIFFRLGLVPSTRNLRALPSSERKWLP